MLHDIVRIRTSACVNGGRKPPNISSLADSWTAAASIDLTSRVTYFSPGCLVLVGGTSESWGVSEWQLNRCPQVLHFDAFDFFGVNWVHGQGVTSFEAPVQTIRIEGAMM
jgi:hypothetical protein